VSDSSKQNAVEPSNASGGLWGKHYSMLDAWRGLAAVGVVLSHLNAPINGHFAVMMFFVISGYCISASADSCLKKELGFGGFMYRRVRRIYPPYLLV
jgi:peptidoglycan/LPS O-acetylase OafA/YrhL